MTILFLALLAQDPRIEAVVPAAEQPWRADPAVVLYDPFDEAPSLWPYLEPKADEAGLSDAQALGRRGRSLELGYRAGRHGEGGRKLVFGDSPAGRPLRKGERFDVLYWRHYVYHPAGWKGGAPDKMSRATILTSPSWQQASILHVWSAGDALTLDPATGVRGTDVVTTRYNDFPNLRWLGNAPKGSFPTHGRAERGRWICVEAMMKLNAPGRKDGEARLWVDGRLDADRAGLDFRGGYGGHGINAVYLEAYWNAGSPADQSRWYDDFVVSTKPVGPAVAEPQPTLIRSRAVAGPWEAEIASDPEGATVVWRSGPQAAEAERVTAAALPKGTYYCRIRAGAWSPWHQPFVIR